MRCKETQELLLTDYADGEASARAIKAAEDHLAACDKCRAFREKLRKTAMEPFDSANRSVPPPEIWDNIKAALAGDIEPREAGLYARLKILLGDLFKAHRPAITVTAVAAAVLAAVIIAFSPFGRPNGVSEYFEEQAEFFMYPDMNGESKDYPDFGTGIEEYFL